MAVQVWVAGKCPDVGWEARQGQCGVLLYLALGEERVCAYPVYVGVCRMAVGALGTCAMDTH